MANGQNSEWVGRFTGTRPSAPPWGDLGCSKGCHISRREVKLVTAEMCGIARDWVADRSGAHVIRKTWEAGSMYSPAAVSPNTRGWVASSAPLGHTH